MKNKNKRVKSHDKTFCFGDTNRDRKKILTKKYSIKNKLCVHDRGLLQELLRGVKSLTWGKASAQPI